MMNSSTKTASFLLRECSANTTHRMSLDSAHSNTYHPSKLDALIASQEKRVSLENERKATTSRRVSQKENIKPNIENLARDQHYLDKISKFNNKRLFKATETKKELSPFKVAKTEKETLFSSADFKHNVLAKKFPLSEKQEQEALIKSAECTYHPTPQPAEDCDASISKRTTLDTSGLNRLTQSIEYVPNVMRSLNEEFITEEKSEECEKKERTLPLHLPLTILVILLSIVAAVYIRVANKPPVYCNSGSELLKSCLVCPDNANCLNGKMECQYGYYLDAGQCKQSLEKYKAKDKYIETISEILGYRRGEHSCDQTLDYTYSFDELEKMVSVQHGSDSFYQDAIKLVEADLKNAHDKGIVYHFETERFSAQEAILPMQCKVKTFLQENFLLVFLTGLVICVSLTNFAKYQTQKNNRQIAQTIYSEIVIDLNRVKGRCVKELYDSIDDKYGEDAAEILWPLVEELRLKYGQVLIYKDEYKGSYEFFWKI